MQKTLALLALNLCQSGVAFHYQIFLHIKLCANAKIISHSAPSDVIMHQIASRRLPLLSVVTLISFLAYGPQILFQHIEPHALERKQAIIFNVLVCCIWISYARTCFTNPGWIPHALSLDHSASGQSLPSKRTPRWCRRCEAMKPPRAHHCKTCRR